MLAVNTSLQYLFLNPVEMEEPEALDINDAFNMNPTLELL